MASDTCCPPKEATGGWGVLIRLGGYNLTRVWSYLDRLREYTNGMQPYLEVLEISARSSIRGFSSSIIPFLFRLGRANA
jgi:hypothetical protein